MKEKMKVQRTNESLQSPGRRDFLKKAAILGGAGAAGWTTNLFTSKRSWAAPPIKIGYIQTLSGNYAYLGYYEKLVLSSSSSKPTKKVDCSGEN